MPPPAARPPSSSPASPASARPACSGARRARERARGPDPPRPLPRARRRADPLRADRRRAAADRARRRRAHGRGLPAATRNALVELLPELGGTGTRSDEEHRRPPGPAVRGAAHAARAPRPRRAGAADAGGRPLGGLLDARLHHLPRAQRARGVALPRRDVPLRRAAPPPPAPAGAGRARARRRRGAGRARALRPREVVQQLEGILQEPPSPDLADRLYGRSQGNALYTEELLAASDDGWLLPETLRDALLTRVEQLSPAGQAVVRVAAVLDRPITHGLLEAVAELSPAEVMEGAREAVAHQVLVIGEGALYRSATRSSARRSTATCCRARTPRCTRASPR